MPTSRAPARAGDTIVGRIECGRTKEGTLPVYLFFDLVGKALILASVDFQLRWLAPIGE